MDVKDLVEKKKTNNFHQEGNAFPTFKKPPKRVPTICAQEEPKIVEYMDGPFSKFAAPGWECELNLQRHPRLTNRGSCHVRKPRAT